MARNTQTTTVRLDLSASQAKATLKALQTQARQLADAMHAAATAGDEKTARRLEADLNRTNSIIRNMQTNARNAAQVLASLDKSTPNELKRTLSYLTRQIGGMTQGTEAYIRTAENIRRVRAQLDSVNSSMREQGSLWDRIKNAGTGAVAAGQYVWGKLTGVMAFAEKTVGQYAELEGEMANVRKYSGMTEEEVAELNEEFKKMDTRSSREQLNKLAQDAGRLGKNSVEDVLGFVRAADQINVALDDLGDGATLTLSKLAGLFGIEERYGTEQGLLKVGAVINDLSQNCSASAPYIAEFTSRMGAAGVQAGMTIPQIMAYAAVMDECNVNVEASSTALSQLIMKIFKDPAKYAKAAGLEVKEFYTKMTTDANEGFLMLIEALSKKGGLDKLAPVFAEMGANGSEAQKALGLLAKNIDKVRAQQDAANESFELGTSISEEFAVQNNTVSASLDKARKEIHETTVQIGERLLPVMNLLLSGSGAGLSAVKAMIDFVIRNRVALISLTAAVAAYVAVAKIQAAWDNIIIGLQKAKALAMATGRNAMLLLSAATNALTGHTTRAAAAMRMFKASTGVAISGLGLVVAAIAGAVASLIAYRMKADAAADAQARLNDIKKSAAARAAEERAELDLLLKVARDETASLDARHKAIEKLNDIIPNYNAQLNDTTGKYTENKKALDDYLASLVRFYEIEGAKDMLKELGGKNARLRKERQEAQEELESIGPGVTPGRSAGANISTNGAGSAAGLSQMFSSGLRQGVENRIDDLDEKIEVNNRQIELITRVYGQDIATAKAPSSPTSDVEDVAPLGGGGDTPPSSAADKKAAEKKAREDFKKGLEEIEAQRELADAASMVSMRTGLIKYSDYRQQMQEHEETMLTAKIKYYEDAGLGDDDDVAELTKKLEQSRMKWQESVARLKMRDIRSGQNADENAAQLAYATPGSDIFRDEEALQIRLFEIRRKWLEATRDLYAEGTEERADAVSRIEEAEAEEQLRRQKATAEQLARFQEEYTTIPIERRRDMELAALDALHEKELISEEDYRKARKKLIEKYEKDIKDFGKDSDEEFKASNEWTSMVQGMYDAIRAFIDSSEGDLTDWAGRVAALAQAAFAAFSMAMSGASALMSANADYDVAVVSKAYDRQIALAKNNSARQQRLEKQKEAAISAQRAKSAKRDFTLQVAMAVAQTATNAIQAYYEGLKIGGMAGLVMAPIAAAMATAAGVIQIATIKKQKDTALVQGYSSGGFTRKGAVDEPAGIVHAGEWVASQRLVNNPATRPLIDILEYAQRTNVMPAITASDVSAPALGTAAAQARSETAIAEQRAVLLHLSDTVNELRSRLEEPIVAVARISGPDGIDNQKRRYDQLIKNTRRK